MFNYNKYPGPDFVYVADLLKSDACQFTVLENHKDALDATRFGQRFSEIMLKYDYIVGALFHKYTGCGNQRPAL